MDLTIDGADEIDSDLNLVKGGGGALLHEKIVAAASDRMVVIADASKLVPALGAFPLPVEVVPFGWRVTRSVLEEALSGLDVLGREVRLRAPDRGGAPFVTDGGNYCLDLHLGRIADPWRTALVLNAIPGIVDNGLFLGMCDAVLIGHGDGSVERRDADAGTRGDRARAAGPENAFADL